MPIFEYVCPECGARFESLKFASEIAEETPCPECGVERTEKLVSTFASGASSSSASCGGGSGFR